MTEAILRPARDEDADGIIRVVSECWREYPGCVVDIDGEAPELRALATHLEAKGGAALVADAAGEVVGVGASWPVDGAAWEIGKLYVDRTHRGGDLAASLLSALEQKPRQAASEELVLWSDTRFTRAHAFYEKHGFVRRGPLRALDDRSRSIEFGYAKPLRGVVVRALDAGAAGSAIRPLADLLAACVDAGASVSFLRPMPRDLAREFWQRRAREVAAGTRLLLAGWVDGALAGTVTVDIDMPPNQPHRAEVQKLLVHPAARRRGLGRALMQAAEQAARAAGRTLLTLDTREADAGEALYRQLGFTETGRIPGFGLNPDGTGTHATVLFWKRVAPAA